MIALAIICTKALGVRLLTYKLCNKNLLNEIVNMQFENIPLRLRQNDKIELCLPDLNRLFEMQALIEDFGDEHQFLWGITKEDSLEKTAKHMAKSVEKFKSQEDYVFHIIEVKSKKLVGCIGIHPERPPMKYCRLGYWIGSAYKGQGYGTQACIMARDIALKFMKPLRLELGTAKSNKASQAVAKKAGFELEAILRNYCLGQDGKHEAGLFYIYPNN